MPDLDWTRPLALWSLALPVAVLLLSTRRERPRPVPLGTFALWSSLVAASGAARHRRVTLARWFWIACLVLTALALAGPRMAQPSARPVLEVIVDRSPSMYLEHTLPDGRPSGQGTRLAAALSELAARSELEPFDLRWRTREVGAGAHASPGAAPPAEWRSPPAPGAEQREWSALDRAGSLWLTDTLGPRPTHAGWLAVGGGPVPGPAAREGRRLFVWNGTALEERESGLAARRVHLGAGLSQLVSGLAGAWAEARGHELVGAPGDPAVALSVHPVGSRSAGELGPRVRAGRDGWWIEGAVAEVPASHAGRPLETWLAAPLPLVSWRAGHLYWGLAGEDLGGDPAAFAVSLSRLLDRALLPDPTVVPVAERAAAGELEFGAPRAHPAGRAGSGSDAAPLAPLATVLAGLAVAFGAVALGLRGAGVR